MGEMVLFVYTSNNTLLRQGSNPADKTAAQTSNTFSYILMFLIIFINF